MNKTQINRAILSNINDGGALQNSQLETVADDIHDNVERFQQFGFTGVPLDEAEAIVVFVAGNHDHPIIISAENRDLRIKGLKAGETAMYNSKGHKIVLYHDKCEIHAPKLIVNADNIVLNGEVACTKNITANGNISDQGGSYSMAGMRAVYDSHTHNETNNTQTAPPNSQM